MKCQEYGIIYLLNNKGFGWIRYGVMVDPHTIQALKWLHKYLLEEKEVCDM